MASAVSEPAQPQNFEDMVMQVIMRRSGTPEDEARLIVEAMRKRGELEPLAKGMAQLAANADTLQRLPPDTQRDFASMIMAKSLTEDSSSHGNKYQDLIVLQKMGLIGDNKNAETEKLKMEIEQMKENERKRQFEEFQNSITTKLAAIEGKVAAGPAVPATQPGDPITDLVKNVSDLQEKQKALQGLLGVVGGGGSNLMQAKEDLMKAGYKVEGPITPAELEAFVKRMQVENDAKIAKAIHDAKEEEAKKAQNFQETFNMVTQVGGILVDVVSMFMPDAPKATASKLGDALRKARSVGGGPAAPVAPGAPVVTATSA
jgi:hypothetical protein